MEYDIVDVGIINRYLKQYNLSTEGTKEERTRRLAVHFETELGPQDRALCDRCGGVSDASLAECPYCGDSEPIAGEIITAPEYTEADLDIRIDAIRGATRRTYDAMWELGTTLKEIREKNLWKLRTDEHGNQRYGTWILFCEKELDVSPTTAQRLIGVVSEYTPKQLAEHGITRLSTALNLPRTLQKKLLKESRNISTSSPEFRDLARKIHSEADQQSNGAAVDTDVPHRLTYNTDIPLGTVLLPMWVRPKIQMPVGAITTPAKSITDDPWTKVHVVGDLWLFIRLRRNATGEIESIVEFRCGIERRDTL